MTVPEENWGLRVIQVLWATAAPGLSSITADPCIPILKKQTWLFRAFFGSQKRLCIGPGPCTPSAWLSTPTTGTRSIWLACWSISIHFAVFWGIVNLNFIRELINHVDIYQTYKLILAHLCSLSLIKGSLSFPFIFSPLDWLCDFKSMLRYLEILQICPFCLSFPLSSAFYFMRTDFAMWEVCVTYCPPEASDRHL